MGCTWYLLTAHYQSKNQATVTQTPLLLNPKCFQFEVEVCFRTMVESSFFEIFPKLPPPPFSYPMAKESILRFHLPSFILYINEGNKYLKHPLVKTVFL